MSYDAKKSCWNCKNFGVRRDDGIFRCSMCSVNLSPEVRPIVVGDYVRWEHFVISLENWVEGEIVGIHGQIADILLFRVGSYVNRNVGSVRLFGLYPPTTIRRIPRPELDRIIHCQGYLNGKQCEATTRDSSATMEWRCSEHDVCTAFVGGSCMDWCGYCGCGSGMHKQPESVTNTLSRYTEYHMQPYDGLTVEQCLEHFQRWMREGGNRALTPSQLTAARELWSAQLRVKVEASESERKRREPSVIVDIEDY